MSGLINVKLCEKRKKTVDRSSKSSGKEAQNVIVYLSDRDEVANVRVTHVCVNASMLPRWLSCVRNGCSSKIDLGCTYLFAPQTK